MQLKKSLSINVGSTPEPPDNNKTTVKCKVKEQQGCKIILQGSVFKHTSEVVLKVKDFDLPSF